jgi:hypothetical protein
LGKAGTDAVQLIDWSDVEGMFGLLIDVLEDERKSCDADRVRARFLGHLLAELRGLESRIPEMPLSDAIEALAETRDAVDPEFRGDSAVVHLEDCIAELRKADKGAT